jgi:phage recombination protein Bet
MSTTAVAAPKTDAPAPPSALSLALANRDVTEPMWNTLRNSLFPGAKAESVLLVIDYCKARKLDPMKKPCHIVPIKVKVGSEWETRDVVMPGIYEYRTTAMRTGLYRGHSTPEFGPTIDVAGVKAPEWCSMVMRRGEPGGPIDEFPVKVYFREVVAMTEEWSNGKRTGNKLPNDRWSKAPIQMLTKCAEAAGLREAFPDEFGGEPTMEEVEGQSEASSAQPVITAAQRRTTLLIAPQDQSAVETTAATPVPSTPAAIPEAPATDQAGVTMPPPQPQQSEPARPAAVGIIVSADPKNDGKAMLVTLDTGFRASTSNGEMMQAAAALRDTKRRVEITSTPNAKPGFAPKIDAIEPVAD